MTLILTWNEHQNYYGATPLEIKDHLIQVINTFGSSTSSLPTAITVTAKIKPASVNNQGCQAATQKRKKYAQKQNSAVKQLRQVDCDDGQENIITTRPRGRNPQGKKAETGECAQVKHATRPSKEKYLFIN